METSEDDGKRIKVDEKSSQVSIDIDEQLLEDKNVDESHDCPICLREIEPDLEARTICGHVYCMICLFKVLRTSNHCPYCRAPMTVRDVSWRGAFLVKPTLNPFGSIYVQGGTIGLASYHFDEDLTQCYISYVRAHNSWRLMDNSRPPNKKFFEGATYNDETRTFYGIINWGNNPFRTQENITRWEYNFTFSEDFSHIISGTCKMFDKDDQEQESHTFQPSYDVGPPGKESTRRLRVPDGHFVRSPHGTV